MGAWGIKTFENDDASNWLYDLEETSDLSLIESTLNESSNEYVEAPEGCNILAASEVILALQGKQRVGFPDNAKEWVSKNKSLNCSHLNPVAIKALEKVISEASELNELWQETEDYDDWRKDVNLIKTELSSS